MNTIPEDEDPVVLDPEQGDYDRKRELLYKIKICVSYDLISQIPGQLAQYDTMSPVDKRRFKKQCSRLFDVCINNHLEEEYITDRYNGILQDIESGSYVEQLERHRSPYIK